MFALGWATGSCRPFGRDWACLLYWYGKELSLQITADSMRGTSEKKTENEKSKL